ncbi:peptidoglycan recognition protein [Paraconexibacter antarcticus]|uniref:Peptidoglycan recognition protein n=1 Tax=Paraconexibacter antarcticus TaxID=2949664 RepID=A0ABY5DWR6_9ACTN|nr:peptidoglycan recognition protein [Paraconexibacter antarcticus]UTI66456.1 peptidoglycan recognition protein [Paraconexibacter antarcticus]
MTRRRVLRLGVAGGVGALLLGAEGPDALGAPAAAAATRSRGLALPAGAVPGGGRAGAVVVTPAPFDLVGLRGVALDGAHAELRVRRRGGWSPWVPLGAGTSHAPDRPRAVPASDPVWAGGADALQLRARRRLTGGRLALVTVGEGAIPAPAAHAGLRAAAGSDGGAAPRQAAAPTIVPRAAWGADAVPPRAAPSYGVVNLAFVHHTVNANDYAPEDSPRIVLAIAKYHRDTNGWNDIGYNFLVDRFGTVFEGRAGGITEAVIGAQAGGWNSQSTGIATIGTFTDVPVSDATFGALAQLISWKLSLHGVPPTGAVTLVSGGGKENRYPYGTSVTLQRISGHRDGCTTDCPGNTLYGELGALRARVASYGVGAPVAARIGLASAAPHVRYGDDAALSGQVLAGGGTAAAGVVVSIQKRTSTGGWVRVARARTDDAGRFAATVVYKREGPLRAAATVDGTKVRSPLLTVRLDTLLTLLTPAIRSRVLAGSAVTVRGAIGPSAPVRILVERQGKGGVWTPVTTVRATVAKTAYSAVVPLVKPALYRLTVTAGDASVAPVFVRAVRSATALGGGAGGAGASVG